MLQFFSRRQFNQGLIIIILFFTLVHVLSAHTGIEDETWSNGAPLAQLIHDLSLDTWLSSKLFAVIATGFLLTAQLLLIYRVITSIKNLDKYGLMVSWVYLLLAYLFSEWNDFTPALLSQTILLYVLYSIYQRNDLQKDGFMFTISTLISFSFLLWYPSIFLLPFVLILLFQYNALNLKKISITVLSFSIPLIWYIIYFYSTGQEQMLLYQFVSFHIHALKLYFKST